MKLTLSSIRSAVSKSKGISFSFFFAEVFYDAAVDAAELVASSS